MLFIFKAVLQLLAPRATHLAETFEAPSKPGLLGDPQGCPEVWLSISCLVGSSGAPCGYTYALFKVSALHLLPQTYFLARIASRTLVDVNNRLAYEEERTGHCTGANVGGVGKKGG